MIIFIYSLELFCLKHLVIDYWKGLRSVIIPEITVVYIMPYVINLLIFSNCYFIKFVFLTPPDETLGIYPFILFADNTRIPASMQFQPNTLTTNLSNSNENSNMTTENQLPFGTSSDSESPTEPVSQQTVAMLRARVVPNKQ